MSALYFFRHGQAGLRHTYDELSDTGRTQSTLLGEYLAGQKLEFSAVYTGTLARQQETARYAYEACCRAGVALPAPIVDPRWNEFDLTAVMREVAPLLSADDPEFKRDYEQLQRAVAADDSELHRRWTPCDSAALGAWITARYAVQGETWNDFCGRVRDCRETLSRHGNGDAIAIFTSATPISLWAGMALGLDVGKVMGLAGVMYNSAITTFRLRGEELALFSFNGVPHLADPALRTFR